MRSVVLTAIPVLLLVFSSLLGGFLSLLLESTLGSLRKGCHNGLSDPAGFVMGQGYTFVAAMAGAASAGLALLLYRGLWIWAVGALVFHALVMVGVGITNEMNDRLGRERAREADRLVDCPECGAKVRVDRLGKHIGRVHRWKRSHP